MHLATVKAGWDTFFFGIPLVALLFIGYFRLDEIFASRKRVDTPRIGPLPKPGKKRPSMLTDPDGRPWDEPWPRKR